VNINIKFLKIKINYFNIFENKEYFKTQLFLDKYTSRTHEKKTTTVHLLIMGPALTSSSQRWLIRKKRRLHLVMPRQTINRHETVYGEQFF
jgi:hypothetical protein